MGLPSNSSIPPTSALADVVTAANRLLSERVDLAFADGRDVLSDAIVSAALVVTGGAVLLCALAAADIVIFEHLQAAWSRAGVLICAAVTHGAAGTALILAGVRRRKRRS